MVKVQAYKQYKKGIIDILWVVLMVFALGIMMFIMAGVWDEMLPMVNETLFAGATGQSIEDNATVTFGTTWDYLFLMFYLAILITAFTAAMMVDSHPVLAVVLILFGMIFMIIPPVLSNVYDEFSTNSFISGVAVNHPIANFILNHYAELCLLALVIFGVTLYGKSKFGTY